MDLFTGLIYGFIVALAYGVGEFVGTRKREREIAAKIVDNMLKELQQDHVLEMIGMIYLQELKREEIKMQSTKQPWDWRIQETLVKEVLRLEPENEYIKKWCEMTNHHGANVRKARDYYLKHGKSPEENGEYPKGACI